MLVSEQGSLALIAALAGFVAGVVLFLPFVALSYRRHGRVTLGRGLLWAAALVYFFAIWSYTLLPLPAVGSYTCVGVNLDPGTFVTDLQAGLASGNPLRSSAFTQLALNVLLFLPLGAFIRVLGGRGVVVAFLAGAVVSGLIETTQLTGVWGLYPCAYRVFDVVDLLTNTGGAVLGSVLALALPPRWRQRDTPDAIADLPRPVTWWRRLLAMSCDLIGLIALRVCIAWPLTLLAYWVGGASVQAINILATVLAALVWLAVTLATGRSPGDLAVRLEYRGGRIPVPLRRLLRHLGGVGSIDLLGLVPTVGDVLPYLFVAVAWAATLCTKDHRGLPGFFSGQALFDARTRRDG